MASASDSKRRRTRHSATRTPSAAKANVVAPHPSRNHPAASPGAPQGAPATPAPAPTTKVSGVKKSRDEPRWARASAPSTALHSSPHEKDLKSVSAEKKNNSSKHASHTSKTSHVTKCSPSITPTTGGSGHSTRQGVSSIVARTHPDSSRSFLSPKGTVERLPKPKPGATSAIQKGRSVRRAPGPLSSDVPILTPSTVSSSHSEVPPDSSAKPTACKSGTIVHPKSTSPAPESEPSQPLNPPGIQQKTAQSDTPELPEGAFLSSSVVQECTDIRNTFDTAPTLSTSSSPNTVKSETLTIVDDPHEVLLSKGIGNSTSSHSVALQNHEPTSTGRVPPKRRRILVEPSTLSALPTETTCKREAIKPAPKEQLSSTRQQPYMGFRSHPALAYQISVANHLTALSTDDTAAPLTLPLPADRRITRSQQQHQTLACLNAPAVLNNVSSTGVDTTISVPSSSHSRKTRQRKPAGTVTTLSYKDQDQQPLTTDLPDSTLPSTAAEEHLMVPAILTVPSHFNNPSPPPTALPLVAPFPEGSYSQTQENHQHPLLSATTNPKVAPATSGKRRRRTKTLPGHSCILSAETSQTYEAPSASVTTGSNSPCLLATATEIIADASIPPDTESKNLIETETTTLSSAETTHATTNGGLLSDVTDTAALPLSSNAGAQLLAPHEVEALGTATHEGHQQFSQSTLSSPKSSSPPHEHGLKVLFDAEPAVDSSPTAHPCHNTSPLAPDISGHSFPSPTTEESTSANAVLHLSVSHPPIRMEKHSPREKLGEANEANSSVSSSAEPNLLDVEKPPPSTFLQNASCSSPPILSSPSLPSSYFRSPPSSSDAPGLMTPTRQQPCTLNTPPLSATCYASPNQPSLRLSSSSEEHSPSLIDSSSVFSVELQPQPSCILSIGLPFSPPKLEEPFSTQPTTNSYLDDHNKPSLFSEQPATGSALPTEPQDALSPTGPPSPHPTRAFYSPPNAPTSGNTKGSRPFDHIFDTKSPHCTADPAASAVDSTEKYHGASSVPLSSPLPASVPHPLRAISCSSSVSPLHSSPSHPLLLCVSNNATPLSHSPPLLSSNHQAGGPPLLTTSPIHLAHPHADLSSSPSPSAFYAPGTTPAATGVLSAGPPILMPSSPPLNDAQQQSTAPSHYSPPPLAPAHDAFSSAVGSHSSPVALQPELNPHHSLHQQQQQLSPPPASKEPPIQPTAALFANIPKGFPRYPSVTVLGEWKHGQLVWWNRFLANRKRSQGTAVGNFVGRVVDLESEWYPERDLAAMRLHLRTVAASMGRRTLVIQSLAEMRYMTIPPRSIVAMFPESPDHLSLLHGLRYHGSASALRGLRRAEMIYEIRQSLQGRENSLLEIEFLSLCLAGDEGESPGSCTVEEVEYLHSVSVWDVLRSRDVKGMAHRQYLLSKASPKLDFRGDPRSPVLRYTRNDRKRQAPSATPKEETPPSVISTTFPFLARLRNPKSYQRVSMAMSGPNSGTSGPAPGAPATVGNTASPTCPASSPNPFIPQAPPTADASIGVLSLTSPNFMTPPSSPPLPLTVPPNPSQTLPQARSRRRRRQGETVVRAKRLLDTAASVTASRLALHAQMEDTVTQLIGTICLPLPELLSLFKGIPLTLLASRTALTLPEELPAYTLKIVEAFLAKKFSGNNSNAETSISTPPVTHMSVDGGAFAMASQHPAWPIPSSGMSRLITLHLLVANIFLHRLFRTIAVRIRSPPFYVRQQALIAQKDGDPNQTELSSRYGTCRGGATIVPVTLSQSQPPQDSSGVVSSFLQASDAYNTKASSLPSQAPQHTNGILITTSEPASAMLNPIEKTTLLVPSDTTQHSGTPASLATGVSLPVSVPHLAEPSNTNGNALPPGSLNHNQISQPLPQSLPNPTDTQQQQGTAIPMAENSTPFLIPQPTPTVCENKILMPATSTNNHTTVGATMAAQPVPPAGCISDDPPTPAPYSPVAPQVAPVAKVSTPILTPPAVPCAVSQHRIVSKGGIVLSIDHVHQSPRALLSRPHAAAALSIQEPSSFLYSLPKPIPCALIPFTLPDGVITNAPNPAMSNCPDFWPCQEDQPTDKSETFSADPNLKTDDKMDAATDNAIQKRCPLQSAFPMAIVGCQKATIRIVGIMLGVRNTSFQTTTCSSSSDSQLSNSENHGQSSTTPETRGIFCLELSQLSRRKAPQCELRTAAKFLLERHNSNGNIRELAPRSLIDNRF